MKRLVSMCAIAGMLLAAPAAMAGIEGDYNDDGSVNDEDRVIIFEALDSAAGDADFVEAADHDGDGVISLVDVSRFSAILQAQ